MTERPATVGGRNASARGPGVGNLRLDLRRDTAAPATARAAVERWCPELPGGRARQDTLLLLVSEVVTNAVMHSHAPAEEEILLIARIDGGTVHVDVSDSGQGFAPPSYEASSPPERMTIGGYGLYVVDRAASRWGVEAEVGTRVWFEM